MSPVKDVVAHLGRCRLIPVIVIEDAKEAAPLARALLEGGLPCAEVTFRTDAAAEAIREMAARKEMVVGAGTVLTPKQADQAVEAGASFIVTPGFDSAVVRHCLDRKLPIFPGTATPTEIGAAHSMGLDIVKFFPAEAFGGVKTLQAVSGPYPKMRFIPTGGIAAKNLRDYLAFPRVFACGGSWMCSPELLKARRFDEVTRLAREAVALAAVT